ncbi:MAG: hypothetical protein PHS93_10335 [Candidatus Omnitrophica bacterium]|nr:hypothetical protein [Candidatus Omnitrophota bacterium]MDD5353548.1 hypothetical protein [Candidatus Omnitrophota bacterium]
MGKKLTIILIIVILSVAGYLYYNYAKSKKRNQAAIDLYTKNMYDWMSNDPTQRAAVQKKATAQGNTLEQQLRADAQWYTDNTPMADILANYEKRQHKTA